MKRSTVELFPFFVNFQDNAVKRVESSFLLCFQ